jgi:hypothetical protein
MKIAAMSASMSSWERLPIDRNWLSQHIEPEYLHSRQGQAHQTRIHGVCQEGKQDWTQQAYQNEPLPLRPFVTHPLPENRRPRRLVVHLTHREVRRNAGAKQVSRSGARRTMFARPGGDACSYYVNLPDEAIIQM